MEFYLKTLSPSAYAYLIDLGADKLSLTSSQHVVVYEKPASKIKYCIHISINLVAQRIQVKLVLRRTTMENINIHLCICLTEKFKQFATIHSVCCLCMQYIYISIYLYIYIFEFSHLFRFIEQRFQFAARLLCDSFQ